jgi:hypothetical protein
MGTEAVDLYHTNYQLGGIIMLSELQYQVAELKQRITEIGDYL